jgi:hypothetical protein
MESIMLQHQRLQQELCPDPPATTAAAAKSSGLMHSTASLTIHQ